MKKRLTGLALAALLAVPMFAGTSAQAASGGEIVFVGQATIGGGTICYPALCTKGPRTFRLVAPNPILNVLCEGAEASAKKNPPVNAGSCSMDVSGQLTGALGGPWCGQSLITGLSGTVTINGNTYTIAGGDGGTAASGFVAVGNASKGAQSGVFEAQGAAIPDVTQGQSCAPPGATEFLVTGTATVAVV